jgi:hypothetical protein
LARIGVPFQNGWTTFQLAPLGTPTPHEYTQPHSFATTGKHRRVGAAGTVALNGAARFDAVGSAELPHATSEPWRPLVEVTYAPEPEAREQLVELLLVLLDKAQ